ncbi:MAG: serine/threonine protein kinase [Cellulomonadaceae bacterium]|nr:serine/threonine protein kinase [Cellulomonadaceae bacterium]
MNGFELLFMYDVEDVGVRPAPTLLATGVREAFGVAAAQFLGSGAFGETWRIPGEAPGRPDRAVKIIVNPQYPAALIDREVAGLRRIEHPNVVRLLDRVDAHFGPVVRQALVFEFVAGGDLSDRLATSTASPEDVHRFAVALLRAAEAMHAKDTVHRDIKPQNIALRGGDIGNPVLLDLGLAKLLEGESLTLYPQPVGTCAFMAPEQVRGDRAGKQADVWAIGVVLYVLLTGRHPFFGPRHQAMTSAQALAAFAAGPRPIGVTSPVATAVTTMLGVEPYARGSIRRHLKHLDTLNGDAR